MSPRSDLPKDQDVLINISEVERINKEVEKFSASFAERAIIKKMLESMHTKLMFKRRDLHTILLYAFKEYRKKSDIDIQKFALLERDQRDQLFMMLKNVIMDTFIPIFSGKREELLKYLNSALDEFFKPYLQF